MNYIIWAIIALIAYSIFSPLAKLATEGMPSNVVALGANTMLAVAALAITLYHGDDVVSNLTGDRAIYVFGAGLCLSVGILAYYEALAEGPVSAVNPIYGSFIVFSSLIGILFLGDAFTVRKAAGIALTMVGVYLTAG